MGTAYSNTHVANATDNCLRIFYQVKKMETGEIVVKVGAGVEGGSSGASGNVSAGADMVFKPDTRVRYIRLPPRETVNFAGEGTLYASVLVEDQKQRNNCVDIICVNFHVPSDRSFIVTQNGTIKLQKYGANIWVDEDGVNHEPYEV